MNEIAKPLSILQSEFSNDLSYIINHSGLPPFMMLPYLKEAWNELSVVAREQLNADYQEYQKKIAKAEQVCQGDETAEEDCV